MAIIETKNLTKTYGSGATAFTALKDADVGVEAGEFIGVVGRSGSGKSTLLYQMSLLDSPTSGSLLLYGQDMTNKGAETCSHFRIANFGYVFQDYALLPDLTAQENVALPMLMLGFTRAESYSMAARALADVGLGDKFSNRPNMLSGGEQQRVSIARATAHGAKVVFADEPTASLDSETASRVMEVFADIHRAGRTIIMVSHEPEHERYFDRVLELQDGTVISRKPKRKR